MTSFSWSKAQTGRTLCLSICTGRAQQSLRTKNEVTFKKYGSTDFLNSISVQGDDSGMKILQTKAEQKAAKTGYGIDALAAS